MRARSTKLPEPGSLMEVLFYDDDILTEVKSFIVLGVIKTRRASFVEDAKLIDLMVLDPRGKVVEFSLHESELCGVRWYGSRKVMIRTT